MGAGLPMRPRTRTALSVGLICLIAAGVAGRAQRSQLAPSRPDAFPIESQRAFIADYCSGCHNDKLKSGGMTLTALDLTRIPATPELAEKMIRKLRTGLMPPAGAKRPE